MPVKTNVLILCRFQYFFYRYRVNARPKWYNFVSFSNTIEALLAATTLVSEQLDRLPQRPPYLYITDIVYINGVYDSDSELRLEINKLWVLLKSYIHHIAYRTIVL